MDTKTRDVATDRPRPPELIRLADLTLDLRLEELRDERGTRVDLRPRSFAVLRFLVQNAGRVVSRDELLTTLWPGVHVTEDSLTQCVSDIRRLLGENGRDLVRTVARRGYVMAPSAATATAAGRVASSGPTVAVRPFATDASSAGLEHLADALTQQVVSGLGRFGGLRVLSRSATWSSDQRPRDLADVDAGLEPDYLVEATLRRDERRVRLDVRLADARTHAQVWSKTFERDAAAARRLATVDEIAGQASAMIGSYWGAIGAAEYRRIRDRPSAALTPYECIVQAVIGVPTGATERGPVDKAREGLERLVREEPRNAAAWAALVLVFNHQRTWNPTSAGTEMDRAAYNERLASLALDVANRAVEIAPDDAFVRALLARAAWMARQPDLLRIETQRAIELNPNDPQTLGPLGNLMAYAGFWDEGVALADQGIALTAPSTPRWWWWASAKRHFARDEFPEAFAAFRRSYVEQLWISHLHMAYVLPFLDRTNEARAHVAALLRIRPGFTVREADACYRTWCFAPSYREKMCDGLRMARLPRG